MGPSIKLAENVAAKANRQLDEIVEVTFVGNPIMHHLLLGINPLELGGAPFALAKDESVRIRARDLKLSLFIPTHAVMYSLYSWACRRGYRRNDFVRSSAQTGSNNITGGYWYKCRNSFGQQRASSCRLKSHRPRDLRGHRLKCGQRAAPGAIERVRSIEKHWSLNSKSSDVIYGQMKFGVFPKQTKKTGITGICGSGIIEAVAEMYLAGVLNRMV
ncbi:MAG: hypothetical protein CM1200mP30_31200 [Pseudomonadota bacterium]|nr:MAG: hypothetical protein CM1200mP30_31200 [Pseudomonadota bacterium]